MAFISFKDFPTRAVIWIMLFTCTFFSYMLRTNFSIEILAMVEPSRDADDSVAIPECSSNKENMTIVHAQSNSTVPDYGIRYDWDKKLQGLMLGAYFWGVVITSIPGGALAERFGPTKIITISFALAGILTLTSPWMASLHPFAIIASRFFIGIVGGVIFPCCHCLVSRWAPPEEKGKFIGALLGGSLGTVVTWPLVGAIIETLGWDWGFYICGIIVMVWTLMWHYLVSDSPDAHPRISLEERSFIVNSLTKNLSKTKRLPPYKDMVMSLPFWGLLVLHFGNLWGLFFLMTAGPNFLSTVLGFNLGHTGILAALPYLARLIFGFLFGLLGDLIIRKQWMKKTTIRKSFVLFSHVLPGILLLIQTLTGCDVTWAIVLITLSLGSNGSSTITNLQNSQDLAPNFAGTLYGIANCVGSTTGFINPIIVGYLTATHNGLHEWHIIFYIGASVYIGCGLIFLIIGSGDVQPWNNVEKKPIDGIENIGFDDVEQRRENGKENKIV